MNNDPQFNFKYAIASICCMQFVRILLYLRANRTIGPMIKTIHVMFYDLFTFLVVFLCIFFIFEVTGQLLFSELTIYSTFIESCTTLFGSALGGFAYSDYALLVDVNKNVGYLFLTVYLIISAIMLLNFLIAIFSETYTTLTEKKLGLYMKEVISLRKEYEYHPLYSSIVYSIVPLNFIFLPFHICTYKAGSMKFNNFMLHLQYIPVAIFGIVTCFSLAIVLIPFTYLLTCWMKFKFILDSSVYNVKDRCIRILDWLIFLFFGGVFLIIYSFIDTAKYISTLYCENIMTTTTSKSLDQLAIKKDETNSDGTIAVGNSNKRLRFTIHRTMSNKDKINPVMEGLTENALHIIKVILGLILRQLYSHIKKINGDATEHYYIATSQIIKVLNIHLMVYEQINCILLGPTYNKKLDYFDSPHYQSLLDELQMFEFLDNNNPYSDSIKMLESFRHLKTMRQVASIRSGQFKKADTQDVRAKWDETMRNFLLNSQEGFILHQYNLCKAFLIQNSESKEEKYALDITLEEEIEKREKFTRQGKRDSAYFKSNKITPNSSRKALINESKIIKVTDIKSLFNIIKEIERKIKNKLMFGQSQIVNTSELYQHESKIFDNNKLNSNQRKNEIIKVYTKKQFSMINISRNMKAVETVNGK